ncbi:hypothetical protein QJS10_CPB04g01164 [Acorus calamus]|uniref:Uncharacterized protein n=1 Tax=Acorus calamus TaxID=4465 RepID=A0AAV9F0T9_ACOCL|nr:hypothetical protein QJS10_CPB04g01164 [Acorus calamus]
MRASETPSVLRPGIFCTFAPVTTEPMVVLVAPGFASPSKKKSVAFNEPSLHANPFSLTGEVKSATQRSWSMSGSDAKAVEEKERMTQMERRILLGVNASRSQRWKDHELAHGAPIILQAHKPT